MAVLHETSYSRKVLSLCPTTKDVTSPCYCYLSKLVDRKWLSDCGRTALKNWPAF